MFIYYPEDKYMANAYWVNKKVDFLPDNNIYADALQAESPKPKTRIIKYISNGKVDSVKTIKLVQ